MNSRTTEHRPPARRTMAGLGLVAIVVMSLGGCASYAHRDEDIGYSSDYYRPYVTDYYEYYYYPRQHVYYDIHRHKYHYYHDDRGWLAVNQLPSYIHLQRRHHKTLKYRHNRPWNEAHAHKHHRGHRDVLKHGRPQAKHKTHIQSKHGRPQAKHKLHIQSKHGRPQAKHKLHIQSKHGRLQTKNKLHVQSKHGRLHAHRPAAAGPLYDQPGTRRHDNQNDGNHDRRHAADHRQRPQQSKQGGSEPEALQTNQLKQHVARGERRNQRSVRRIGQPVKRHSEQARDRP